MGSGREGSPATSGGSGGVLEERSSTRLALRGTRVTEPGVGSTTLSLRSVGGKKELEEGRAAARAEGFNSPLRRKTDADDARVANSGTNVVVKSSRKGPTRINSAGSSHNSAMEVEAVDSVQEEKLGRQDPWNASTGIPLRSASFRGGIGDLTEREMADVGGKSPKTTRVVEFPELQGQSNVYGRVPRFKTVRSPTRRTRGGSQESVQEQGMDPFAGSQSKVRDSRVTRSRVESPKRNRSEEDDLRDILADMVHDQGGTSHRVSRSIRQGSRTESQDLTVEVGSKIPELPLRNLKNLRAGAETQEEIVTKATGRRSKTTRRHTKKKPDEGNDVSSEEVPELLVGDNQQSTLVKEPRHPASKLPKARASTSSDSTSDTWMQLLEDVIMWKDIPRTTLYFGAGCFGILSTSYVKTTSFGTLTITCYLALLYLAGIYCHRSYLSREQVEGWLSWELSDADVLDVVRVVLPALNLMISKCGQLFCGDPHTTLKVAAMLWILAQLGYWISLWSFARLAFLAVFIVPKLVSYYSHQIQGHAEAVAERVWTAWEVYAHKKAAMVGVFLVTWNFTSALTRIFGAFMMLVAVRAYYGQIPEDGLSEAPRNKVEDTHQEEAFLPIVSASQETLPRSCSPLKEVNMEVS